jgi:hypothetical protein
MDGIKQQIQVRQLEALENKHQHETRKVKREYKAELDKMLDENKSSISKIKKNYSKKELDEKTSLETKLIGIRKKNKVTIKNENVRFKGLTEELDAVHKQKISEIKSAQSKEMEKVEQEHKDYLTNLEDKFKSEQAKLEA